MAILGIVKSGTFEDSYECKKWQVQINLRLFHRGLGQMQIMIPKIALMITL